MLYHHTIQPKWKEKIFFFLPLVLLLINFLSWLYNNQSSQKLWRGHSDQAKLEEEGKVDKMELTEEKAS